MLQIQKMYDVGMNLWGTYASIAGLDALLPPVIESVSPHLPIFYLASGMELSL
jgi:hypothetical protein